MLEQTVIVVLKKTKIGRAIISSIAPRSRLQKGENLWCIQAWETEKGR